MKTKMRKKSILVGIISAAAAAVLTAGGILVWMSSKEKLISPYVLLETAKTRTEQNLCRLEILEENPTDTAVWAELQLGAHVN